MPVFRCAGIALLHATIALAQSDPVLDSRAQHALAVRAYEARDYAGFLQHARAAQALRPTHGGVTYALASALALTGDTAGALQALRHFAKLGYAADVVADSDFATLRQRPTFLEVAALVGKNHHPVVRSHVAFTLPQPDLLTEGIAYDPAQRVFYVGSVRHRKILRVGPNGTVSDFATSERDSLWAPMGMKVDPAHRALWVAASARPQMLGYNPADSGRSGLFRYDLETGKLTGRYLIRPDGVYHVLGDLTLGRRGDVYATDSRAPVIYWIPYGSDSLERLLESPLLLSAQGLALTPDERWLYVAEYARGILRADLRTRRFELLPCPDTLAALGIDGLYWVDGKLIGIQNGMTPARVLRLTLAPDGDRLVQGEVLERAHPLHAEPTLGTLSGRDLYYIANSQWERFGEDGRIAAPDSLKPPTILRLRL
jgi:hypothetical protein